MQDLIRKPRLLFFQGKQSALPGFLQLHQSLQVKCLSVHFEVVLINQHADYKQLCDIYQPDLALFELGYKSTSPNRLTIKNTAAHPQIPKLGLHNGDGWCECRVALFHDMQLWGIETIFSISVTAAEYTPVLADNLFVWPNFIDAEIYQDYHQQKEIPILFNGSMISLYPWRQKIYEIASKEYPPVVLAHLGYGSESSKMVFGAAYAKKINASWFVPACGTIAGEVVRKHFEVPGCRSCLITERTPALEAAGFVDMENCVFADESDVLEKLAYLFDNTQELQRITEAGYDLIHSRHTLKHRDQIFQWFTLNQGLGPDKRIVQSGPFEPLSIVSRASSIKNSHIRHNGLSIALLNKGDEKLWEGEYEEAEKLYLECLKYIPWMSEPKLKLAVCSLNKGDADQGYNWVTEPIHNCLGNYGCKEPDPVEWAYLIRCLLCKGNIYEATIRAKQFPLLHHAELDRIRFALKYILNPKTAVSSKMNSVIKQRLSIHDIPSTDFVDWISNLITMLERCERLEYSKSLANLKIANGLVKGQSVVTSAPKMMTVVMSSRIACVNSLNHIFNYLNIPKRRTGMPSAQANDYVVRLAKWMRLDLLKLVFLKYKSHKE